MSPRGIEGGGTGKAAADASGTALPEGAAEGAAGPEATADATGAQGGGGQVKAWGDAADSAGGSGAAETTSFAALVVFSGAMMGGSPSQAARDIIGPTAARESRVTMRFMVSPFQ
jgi:hypothetical protein